MSETLYLDYAWARPDPALIKSSGYSGVMRYISQDPTKDIHTPELAALRAAGLDIGLVWETTASRAGQGAGAGRSDALAAEAAANALLYPMDAVIFYAVDFNADPAAVLPYFGGIQAVAKRPVGVYGSADVCEGVRRALQVPYAWQCSAWSLGRVSPAAHLYQRQQMTHPIPQSDENVVLRTFPVWGAGLEPPVVPPHVPPIEAPLKLDGSLGPKTIARWQQIMGTGVDGVIFYPRSSLIVAAQQHVGGLKLDGYLGPKTIGGLQRHLRTPVDGKLSFPISAMVVALQKSLNTRKHGSKQF